MTKVFPTRWCTGPPWDPQNHFAIVICDEYYTLYIYTLTIFKKQIPLKKKYRFKMEANDLFCFASFQFRQKYEKKKNTFPKEIFFQWNLSHGFSGKSNFPASPKCWFMLISEKTTGFVWLIDFLKKLILFCLIFLILIYLFVYFILFIFFFVSKGGYPWGWHLKIAPVKNH